MIREVYGLTGDLLFYYVLLWHLEVTRVEVWVPGPPLTALFLIETSPYARGSTDLVIWDRR